MTEDLRNWWAEGRYHLKHLMGCGMPVWQSHSEQNPQKQGRGCLFSQGREGALGFTGITSSWLGFTSLLSAHSTYYPWVLSSKHVFLRSCGHHSLQGSLRTLYLNIQTLHCWFQLVTPVPSLHPLREPLGLSLYILFSAPAFLRSFLYPRISFLLHQEANYHSSTESDSFPNQ